MSRSWPGYTRRVGELRMSAKEWALAVVARVKRKELTAVAAAGLMRLSLRKARRVWKRFEAQWRSNYLCRRVARVPTNEP